MKLLSVSVLGTPGEKIYLKTKLKEKKFILEPEEIMAHCNSHDNIRNGKVLM